jgi:phage protein U
MALGPFPFQSHGFGHNALGYELNTPWAELETIGRLNALQWTGPTSEVVTIQGVLFPEKFGGEGTLAGLRMAAKNGVPLMLVTRAGRVYGLQSIQSIKVDESFHDRGGSANRVAYTIEIKKIGFGFSLLSYLRGLL